MRQTLHIILLRHGETLENRYGVVQGQTDGTLSGKGREQALKAAAQLACTQFDAAFTSDLVRATDTARIVLAGRDDVALVADRRLREQDLGVYVGGPLSGYTGSMARAGVTRERFDPEGGETSGGMRGRVREFFDFIARRHAGGRVLVVTHQGVIRMLGDIMGVELRPGNAEPVEVEYMK